MRQSLITVAIGEGLPLDMAGLALLIESLPGLFYVSVDSDPPPQVLVWDAGMRGPDKLPSLPSETALLLLVADEIPVSIPPGVLGMLSKHEAPETLGVAIRQVARGEQYLSPFLVLAILQHEQISGLAPDIELGRLTEREREILALIGNGLSNKAIAARLYLSVRTVEGHLAKLYPLLGVHSRTEAMLVAVRSGLSSLNR